MLAPKYLVRRLYELARKPNERKLWVQRRKDRKALEELIHQERFKFNTLKIGGFKIDYADALSTYYAYKSIFEDEIYKFDTEKRSPHIIDCGANIGLAVLYWDTLFENPYITAFEPDPNIYKVLNANVERFSSANIALYQNAVWVAEEPLKFIQDHADCGQIGASETSIDIQGIRLRSFLEKYPQEIDLLKMDIEAAETDVLIDCRGALDKVNRIFVEYHSMISRKQNLEKLLDVIIDAGFRVHIQPELVSNKPFLYLPDNYGMDMRLNIFGLRA